MSRIQSHHDTAERFEHSIAKRGELRLVTK